MKIRYLRGFALLAALLLAACAPASGEPEGAESRREVKVTVIVDNVGDLSYNDGIVRELRIAEEKYADSPDIALIVNVFSMEIGTGREKEEIERAFREDGELIIIANQNTLPVLEPAAAYHPDKNFILIDMEATGANIFSALFKPNEAAYLCGFLGARMSETGIIGIVIGMDIPALYDFCVGYILGAQAANPDCKVMISTIGNFYDAEIGYALAAEQFENGADVCFNGAGGAGLGCIRAAKDYGGYAIGVDVDQAKYVDEELRDVIVTSCLKNFDTLTSVILEEYFAGTLEFGQSGRFGLSEGAVGIARNEYYHSMVPQSVQGEIDAQEEMVRNGTIRVRSAFEMTQAEIEELFESAKP